MRMFGVAAWSTLGSRVGGVVVCTVTTTVSTLETTSRVGAEDFRLYREALRLLPMIRATAVAYAVARIGVVRSAPQAQQLTKAQAELREMQAQLTRSKSELDACFETVRDPLF
eukprot:1196229-Prorocentrum_minimum.AAC.11